MLFRYHVLELLDCTGKIKLTCYRLTAIVAMFVLSLWKTISICNGQPVITSTQAFLVGITLTLLALSSRRRARDAVGPEYDWFFETDCATHVKSFGVALLYATSVLGSSMTLSWFVVGPFYRFAMLRDVTGILSGLMTMVLAIPWGLSLLFAMNMSWALSFLVPPPPIACLYIDRTMIQTILAGLGFAASFILMMAPSVRTALSF